jgi:hypothetical protein
MLPAKRLYSYAGKQINWATTISTEMPLIGQSLQGPARSETPSN